MSSVGRAGPGSKTGDGRCGCAAGDACARGALCACGPACAGLAGAARAGAVAVGSGRRVSGGLAGVVAGCALVVAVVMLLGSGRAFGQPSGGAAGAGGGAGDGDDGRLQVPRVRFDEQSASPSLLVMGSAVLLLAVGVGVNLLPTKRGHQD